MNKIQYIWFSLLLLTACEKDLEILPVDAEEQKLVITVMGTTEDDSLQVNLSRTGYTYPEEVSEAEVWYSINGREMKHTTVQGNSFKIDAVPAPGDEASIKVKSGSLLASATTQVPAPVTVVGIDTLWVTKFNDFQKGQTKDYWRFLIHLRLNTESKDVQYFRLVHHRQERSSDGYDYYYEDDETDERTYFMRVYVVDHYDYEYDYDPALSENTVKEATDQGFELFDITTNKYGLFRSSHFKNGEYTLCIDVPWDGRSLGRQYYYSRHDNYSAITFDFKILSITKQEYFYIGAVSVLHDIYESGVLLSNPPIVPSNVSSGVGNFSISSVAHAIFYDSIAGPDYKDTIKECRYIDMNRRYR